MNITILATTLALVLMNGTTRCWAIDGPALIPQSTWKKPHHAYSEALTPAPFPLRSHCLGRDWLEVWKPAPELQPRDTTGHSLEFPILDLARVDQVVRYAYTPTTLEAYGSGLLAYYVFCDVHKIEE